MHATSTARAATPYDARAAISVDRLTKRYANGTLANDGISLTVAAGTATGVLGPNGAGKTTLVRQITGELEPTSGAIHVLGIDVVRRHAAARALMGVVPQEAQPYDHLRPAEHLAAFARLRRMSRRAARDRANELVELLGLAPHARTVARQLSGGLKRKLLVGVALVGDPAVIVLDEPTTGLDPHARREVWTLLKALRAGGRTMIITTHYMEEAEALCDSIALVNRGRIIARGTPAEVKTLGGSAVWQVDAAPPARALERLEQHPEVASAALFGRSLQFSLTGGEPGPVATSLRAAGLECSEPRPVRPTIEHAFLELFRQDEARAEAAP